jgi:uncharacterized protein
MHDAVEKPGRRGRFNWLERVGDDFPFYDGRPVALTGREWALVLGTTFVALMILGLGGPLLARLLGSVIGARIGVAALFAGLPLIALARVAPQGWRLLFRRICFRDVLWMFGFAALNLILTFSVALVLLQYLHMTVNPIVDVKISGLGATLGFLVWTGVQLLGEELLTVLPFLALLTLGFGRMGLGRRCAVVLAWVGSSLIFALVHLPTYNWNLVQCLAVVGVARLGLTLAYVRTKSLWVSTGAHIIYDWSIFGVVALVGLAGIPPS